MLVYKLVCNGNFTAQVQENVRNAPKATTLMKQEPVLTVTLYKITYWRMGDVYTAQKQKII